MVLCFIIALILSSSVPFICVRSMLAACASAFLLARTDAEAAAFSAFGSHDFFACRVVSGTRAIINDVFFGIRLESSLNSIELTMINNKI